MDSHHLDVDEENLAAAADIQLKVSVSEEPRPLLAMINLMTRRLQPLGHRGAVCGRKHVVVRAVEVGREPGRVTGAPGHGITGSGETVRPRLGEKND
ncbi:hypothetical protein OG302_41545 [Streptomyces sp. NBC_01283]|uniref:hypothetical protein n=1 Tax=Streptomyces sp. NBC_01283 TaxID=2903812 RepID=UPI00352E2D34|nr:hypothetical protein OG302_41545 [Streptomyces sp. NBC_01283]